MRFTNSFLDWKKVPTTVQIFFKNLSNLLLYRIYLRVRNANLARVGKRVDRGSFRDYTARLLAPLLSKFEQRL